MLPVIFNVDKTVDEPETNKLVKFVLLNNDVDELFKLVIDNVELVDKLLIDNVELVDKLLIDNVELVDKLFKLVVNAYTETALGVPVIDVVVD